MKTLLFTLFSLLLLNACQNPPVERQGEFPMKTEIGLLPKGEQKAWLNYLQRSEQVRQIDHAFIAKELAALGRDKPTVPPKTKSFGFDENPDAAWFETEEARKIGDILLSFQTPSGGWSKRTDMGTRKRLTGEAFGHESGYIPTFDNDATTTQIRLLARLYTATGNENYKNAVLAGIRLIIAAQYPNGGWPQNFPLKGGYHDHITFNDEVVTNNLQILLAVQRRERDFAFVPKKLRKAVDKAITKGIDCLLNTQISVDGIKTIWAAQHHAITQAPAAARKFEPVALASQESVEVVLFLMQQAQPSQQIINAVNSAVQWFEANAMQGYRWDMVLGEHAALVKDAEADLLWCRFCEIGTNRPVFGDRDGSVHYKVEEISWERQVKYRWYSTDPGKVLKAYRKWQFRGR